MGRLARKVKTDNETGARRAVLEDLFYDFNSSRVSIYWTNFVRGIFFGLGSVLGGTLVVALVIWLLSFLSDVPGWFGEFIEYIVNIVQNESS